MSGQQPQQQLFSYVILIFFSYIRILFYFELKMRIPIFHTSDSMCNVVKFAQQTLTLYRIMFRIMFIDQHFLIAESVIWTCVNPSREKINNTFFFFSQKKWENKMFDSIELSVEKWTFYLISRSRCRHTDVRYIWIRRNWNMWGSFDQKIQMKLKIILITVTRHNRKKAMRWLHKINSFFQWTVNRLSDGNRS